MLRPSASDLLISALLFEVLLAHAIQQHFSQGPVCWDFPDHGRSTGALDLVKPSLRKRTAWLMAHTGVVGVDSL